MQGCLWPNEAPQEDEGQTLPCMHLKRAEAEALAEVMDGAASPRRGGGGARNLLCGAGAGWGGGLPVSLPSSDDMFPQHEKWQANMD